MEHRHISDKVMDLFLILMSSGFTEKAIEVADKNQSMERVVEQLFPLHMPDNLFSTSNGRVVYNREGVRAVYYNLFIKPYESFLRQTITKLN